MDVKLMHESIETGRATEKRTFEVTAAGDVIVPDAMPDIQKILQIDGRARITASTKQGDKLLCEGVADFCILYIPARDESEAPVESIKASLPFKDVCAAAIEDGNFMVEADLLHIGSMLLNSRKLSIKAEIALSLCEWSTTSTQLTTDVEAEKTPEVKTRRIHAKQTAAEDVFSAQVADTLEKPSEKPPFSKILKMDAAAMGQEVKLITGKAIVKGAVRISTLYLTDTYPAEISFMEHDVPFTEILDMPGAAEGMDYAIDTAVDAIYYETDAESGKIGVEVTLRIHGTVTEIVELSLVEDLYIPGYETELSHTTCHIEKAFDSVHDQLAARKLFHLADDVPEPRTVYNVVGKPLVKSASVHDGKAEIEGQVDVYVLYMTEDEETPLFCYQDSIPFSYMAETNAPDSAHVSCRVSLLGCGFTLPSGGGVDVRANLDISLAFHAIESVDNVDAVSVTEEETAEKRPSLVIAFVNEGDSLWDIAKKYKTTISRIAEANHLDEADNVSHAMRLLIP